MGILYQLTQRYRNTGLFGRPFGIDLRQIVIAADFIIFKLSHFHQHFHLNNHQYPYTNHLYNQTYRNERRVELSIATDFIKGVAPSAILEIGNVLSHYRRLNHTIVDKYEKFPRVINHDILEFQPNRKFARIVSLSTLEHIGFDETIKSPTKPLLALKRMLSWLDKQGQLLISVPLGYNLSLDELIRKHRLSPLTLKFMKRISQHNHWHECTINQALSCKYGHPYPCANAIAIGTYTKGL